MKAILFDLDDTLVDSAALIDARDAKRWGEVFGRISDVAPFSVNAHELPGRLKADGMAVGLVTASPKRYVDQILSRFHIEVDVVVTGSDGHPPKPDPSSLNAALDELGVEPEEAAYVGDLATDHEAAALAGVTSIGALWTYSAGGSPTGWLKHWPDLALPAPRLITTIDRWPQLGTIAEVAVTGFGPIRHRGAFLQHADGFSLGRYFTTADQRADRPLSRAIRDNKRATPDAEAFASAIDRFLNIPLLRERLQGAHVISVPSAPDDDYDRFATHRAAAATAVDGVDKSDLVVQRRGVEGYKALRGREARDEVNENRFEVTESLDGQQIVLLDDVATTGSQLASCRTALNQAGAGDVLCLSMAYAQEALSERCPLCGEGIMRLTDGRHGLFWGCSRYWTSGCPHTEDA